jgi:O-antigen/teichoic acid export membrane protein
MIGFGDAVGKSLVAIRSLGTRRAEIVPLGISVAVRLLALLASMATLVLSARWLGPDGRGAIATLSTWAGMGANIAAMSLGQATVRHAAKSRGTAWIGPALSTLLGFTVISATATWVVFAVIYLGSNGQAIGKLPAIQLLLGFAIIPLLIWEQYGSALITLSGRMGLYNIGQVVGRLVVLVLAALFVLLFRMDISGFLLAMLIGQAATALIGTSALIKLTGRLQMPSFMVMKGLLYDGIRLHLNTIGVLLFTGMDILMLQYWRGLEEVGIFQLASQLFITLLIVPQTAILLLNGKIEQLGRVDFWRYHRNILLLVMGVMITGGVLLALIAQPVIVALTSPAFTSSAHLLQIFLIALPAATLNAMMGIQWITRGWLLRASTITLAAGGLNAIANVFLIPRYGAEGAAFATVIGIYAIPFTTNVSLFVFLQREARDAVTP